MKVKNLTLKFCLLASILSIVMACSTKSEKPIDEQIIMDGLTMPKGFVIEKLYMPGKHEQGSWVSVTKDDKGRLFTSDQYGNIYRVTLPNPVNKLDSVVVNKLDLRIGSAQGLLWHKGDLYALVNASENYDFKIHSGLYKITDSNNDGELDKVKTLRLFNGNGEHGPHNIVLSPDKKSLYLVLGNHTDIPKDLKSLVPKVWGEDNLLPVIKDPSGHANSRKAPGGWVVKTDFEGKDWMLISVGMRNTYDISFNADGELFGFDSDMEYDLGMPWYRPIRLFHITSGSEFGWRTGTGKFDETYPDNLSGIGNLGQGSPTGLLNGQGLKFPAYYQNGLYLFDWSYGTMYYAKLKPSGSSYTTEVTEFLSGVPLPLTNGIVGNDGALYFITGGRRLESALYKLSYNGEEPAEIKELLENKKGKKFRKLRKELEVFHDKNDSGKIGFILKNLNHKDRFIRYAARIALEHQDYELWKDEITHTKDPIKTIALSIAIARHGNDAERKNALSTLLNIEWTRLIESQKIDYVRAIDLILIRMKGELSSSLKTLLEETFMPTYLKESVILNKEVCALLSYLQTSEIIAPTIYKMETDTITSNLKSIYLSGNITKRSDQYGKDVEKMLQNMPNQQSISYAKSLSVINEGWTTELREKYFRWYNNALKKSGGKQYSNFIRAIQKVALEKVPKSERQYFEALSSESMNQRHNFMKDVKQPIGPGQNWTVQTFKSTYSKNKASLNFENGQNLFKASLCVSCHSVQGIGGNSGPELTQIGNRFSISDLAAAIIKPSETISDRYRNTNYIMEDGSVISGRVISETERELEISINAFSPELTIKIRKSRIVKKEESELSVMPPTLINRLNAQELSDLIAYLVSGGMREHKIYNK